MAQTNLRGYQTLEKIGAGAGSSIYRARRLRTGRIVAVKQVIAEAKESRKYLPHMHNEYRILRRLERTDGREPPAGFVRAYALRKSGRLRSRKTHSLVMQYVEGRDLRHERRYPVGQIVDFFRQVADVLCYLHERGIVHGDLKPENMIVGKDGSVTLVDFGFSCPAGSRAATVRGTRDYMAPEQVAKGRITEQTDLYNLGATIYYLLGGRHLPALIPPTENGAQHFIGSPELDPTPLSQIVPGLPPGVASLVMRCCTKEPAQRPTSAHQVAAALRTIQSNFTDKTV